MKYLKNEDMAERYKKRSRIWMTTTVILALVVVGLLICIMTTDRMPGDADVRDNTISGTQDPQHTQDTQDSQTTQDTRDPAQDRTETTEDPAFTEPSTVPEGIGISTPYGIFYYPDRWQENLRLDEREENGVYTAVFFGNTGETEVELFSLCIGAENYDGHLFGTMDDGAKVWIRVEALTAEDGWSQDTVDTLNAMQEDVNEIIGQLYDMTGFNAA